MSVIWPSYQGRVKQRKALFSEEKVEPALREAKDFHVLRQRHDAGPFLKRWVPDRGSGGEVKVFWFFSSEKNILPFGSQPLSVPACACYRATVFPDLIRCPAAC